MKSNPSVHRVALPVWLLAALSALLISACGFQPRGQALSLATAVPGPIYIRGIQPYSPLHRELERQLRTGGVEPAASAADSASILQFEQRDSDSRVLSVDSRNKAVEFELEESARFSLRAGDGTQLLGPQSVRVVRIQYRPEDAVLGSERERELLRDDMQRELAGRILRRLAAAR